jgi:hypothetical protein
MKAAAGVTAFLSLAAGLSAQLVTRNFGSVVFPGGTSATSPGVTRNFGSVVFPGSANVPTVRTGVPSVGVGVPPAGRRTFPPNINNPNFNNSNFKRNGFNNRGGSRTPSLVYAYPVFVGSYEPAAYPQYGPGPDPGPGPMPMVQPPGMSMYPTETARPVMIRVPPSPDQPMGAYQPPSPADADQPAPEAQHFLLAFKDHTVYSAVAYWFEGDTLHYFITGSTHNQASLSLLDKELTVRLNKEMGVDFHIPEAK